MTRWHDERVEDFLLSSIFYLLSSRLGSAVLALIPQPLGDLAGGLSHSGGGLGQQLVCRAAGGGRQAHGGDGLALMVEDRRRDTAGALLVLLVVEGVAALTGLRESLLNPAARDNRAPGARPQI